MRTVNTLKRPYDKGHSIHNDLRNLIICEIQELGGDKSSQKVKYGTYSEVSRKFKVSVNSVKNIWLHYCTNDTVSPIKPRGRKNGECRKICAEDRTFIKQLVELRSTFYKRELLTELMKYSNVISERNPVSLSTIFREVRHRITPDTQWTYKKVQHSNSPRWTVRNLLRTQDLFDTVAQLDPRDIYFLDESNFDRSVRIRNYGAAPKGQRALNISRHTKGTSYTLFLLGAINGDYYAKVTEGASTRDTFIEFMSEALEAVNDVGLPVIRRHTYIFSDNAPIHVSAMPMLLPSLEEREISYLYLPAFSPDTNPLEMTFSYLKRKLKDKDFADLMEFDVPTAVLAACHTITPQLMYNVYKNVTKNYMNLV